MAKHSIVYYNTLNSTGSSRIAVHTWGPKNGYPVFCVHGLTGNGLEFQFLAESLANLGYRVIAPDMPGRGLSEDLKNSDDYCYRQYLADIQILFKELQIGQKCAFLGTSMGGLLGIRLTASRNSPICQLILNDIGPEVPEPDLDFIRGVLKERYIFSSQENLKAYLRKTREPGFGPMSESAWEHYAQAYTRARSDGRYEYAYDPAIAKIFNIEPIGELSLWPCWHAINADVLILRGGKSTIFPAHVAEAMLANPPQKKPTMHIFKDCGHVPPLTEPDQISLITAWITHLQSASPAAT